MPSRITRRSDFVGRLAELLKENQQGNPVYDANAKEVLSHLRDMGSHESALGDIDWLDGYRLDRDGGLMLYVTSYTAQQWEMCKRLSTLADIKVTVQLEDTFEGADANVRFATSRANHVDQV